MAVGMLVLAAAVASQPSAQDYQALVHRLDVIEAENAELRRRVDSLTGASPSKAVVSEPAASAASSERPADSPAVATAEPAQRISQGASPTPEPWDHAYAGIQLSLDRQRLRYAATSYVDSLTSRHNTAPGGGIQVGRRWQDGLLVVGLEADGRYVGLNFDHPQQAPNGITFFHRREHYEAELVGEVGVAIGNSLIFGLGGVSVSRVRYFSSGLYPTDARHANLVSPVVGLGFAHKVAPNISVELDGRLTAPGQLTGFDESNPGPINGLVGARITNQKQASLRVNYLLP